MPPVKMQSKVMADGTLLGYVCRVFTLFQRPSNMLVLFELLILLAELRAGLHFAAYLVYARISTLPIAHRTSRRRGCHSPVFASITPQEAPVIKSPVFGSLFDVLGVSRAEIDLGHVLWFQTIGL